jgi:hypothetical protein
MHRFLAPSLLVAMLAISSFPNSSKAEPCGCADLGDLKNRRKEVSVALNLYQSEIERVNNEMIKNRKPIYYTPELKREIQDKVQAALNDNGLGKLSTQASGQTDDLCNISVNEQATSCMQQSTRAHEQAHRDACLQTRNPSRIVDSVSTRGHYKDRFEVKRALLINYAIEEQVAYFTEQNFLVAQLNTLEGSCKPAAPILRDYSFEAADDGDSNDSSSPRQVRRPSSPAPAQQVKGAVNSLRRMFGR